MKKNILAISGVFVLALTGTGITSIHASNQRINVRATTNVSDTFVQQDMQFTVKQVAVGTTKGIVSIKGTNTSAGSVTIPDVVQYQNESYVVDEIENNAFAGNVAITSITMGNHITKIGDFAFTGCTNLTNLMLSEGITAISNDMASQCDSLTDIIIPQSVTTIGGSAFDRANGELKTVTLPPTITTIGNDAFLGSDNATFIMHTDKAVNLTTTSTYQSLNAYFTPNGIVPAVKSGIVTKVDITSQNASVEKGQTTLINAISTPKVNYAWMNLDVDFTIMNATSAQTQILTQVDATGKTIYKLQVGLDETATELQVTATSQYDNLKSAFVKIAITDVPVTPTPPTPPVPPVTPVDPNQPVTPVTPVTPDQPATPVTPKPQTPITDVPKTKDDSSNKQAEQKIMTGDEHFTFGFMAMGFLSLIALIFTRFKMNLRK